MRLEKGGNGMRPFENLKLLKKDMVLKGWVISSFLFRYKNMDYIVLVKLYEETEKRPQYALVKMEFLHINNFRESLEVAANVTGLMADAKTIREFFGIQYSENLGSILEQFCKRVGVNIPTEVNVVVDKKQRNAIEYSLSKSDSEDPNRKYCYKVKRNPIKRNGELGQRSPYNDNMTRLRRPSLYEKLKADSNLSFCYSLNPCAEKTDEEIIFNWTKNNTSSAK